MRKKGPADELALPAARSRYDTRIMIERLSAREGARLRAIRLRALAEAPDAFASTLEATSQRPPSSWRKQLEDLATFVAVLDDRDVGMARGGPVGDRTGDAILLSMWVAPEARGRGVGEALINAVIDWARTQHFVRLVLEVGDDNGPAVALYARMGFEPTGKTATLPAPREHISEHERVLPL